MDNPSDDWFDPDEDALLEMLFEAASSDPRIDDELMAILGETSLARTSSKYTQERATQVLQLIRQGLSRNDAAAATGIHRNTVANWLARHQAFRDGMAQAEAGFIQVCLNGILKAGLRGAPNSWQAFAWLLERKFPESYGQRSRLDVNMELREAVRRVAEQDPSIDQAQLLAVAQEIAEQAYGAGSPT